MTHVSSDTLALTLYPLSTGYRAMLERRLGMVPDYRLVSDLRHGGLGALLRHLWRSHYRRVVLPCEVPEAAAVLSIVELLGAAHKLPLLQVCDPVGNLRRVSLGEIAEGAAGLAGATLAGRRARQRSARAALAARRVPRQRHALPAGPQRVLYLKNNLWFGLRAGGSVGHVAGVINGLVELGHEVRFVSPESPKYLSPKVGATAVPLFGHYALPAEANLFRLQESAVRSALEVAQEFRPTLIYQRLSLGDWTGVAVAQALGLPLIVEYNGSELWVAKNWGGNVRFADEMGAAEDAMLHCADLVFTISEPLQEELLGRGLEPARVAWYPNCVDPSLYSPAQIPAAARAAARQRLGAAEGDQVIMFVGTFGLWHGAEIFAEAATRLARDAAWVQRTRVRFVFVGDGKTRAQCEEIIRAEPAAVARTVFTGLVPQHETPAYLAAADAFVASHVPNADGSKFFGSPTKLFEYMAMERPIVASALDQIAEVLAGEKTAVLVRPGDAAELARGIGRLLEDRELGARVGRAARVEVLKNYTWTRHVQEILAALDRAGGVAK
jgi:glycosyltransferase involved in cell wall biosynthesis